MGLNINAHYDASVTSDPNADAIKGAIDAACKYFENAIKTDITVNINFGYGELQDGAYTIGTQALAEALPAGGVTVSYATLRAALAANGSSADDRAALAALTSKNPAGSGTYYVPAAEAKALGLESAAQAGVDGYVGISNAYNFTFDPANRDASGHYDAIGAFEHEIAHALGRIAGLQLDNANQYTALDLFRYSGKGARALDAAKPGYFSVNGGATNLNPFDGTAGDPGDWASRVQGDAFGYGATGQTGYVTRTDLREMDVLGYTLNLPTDTVGQLLADYASAPSRAYASIADTAAHFTASLNALAALAAPATGAIYASNITDGAAAYIKATASQAAADRGALATIASPYMLQVALTGGKADFAATAHLTTLALTGKGDAQVAGNGHDITFIADNAGDDTISGGGGTAIVSYAGLKTAGIVASLAGGAGKAIANHHTDLLKGIEGIIGSAGNDKIHLNGSGSAWGGGGNDTLTSIGSDNTATDYLYAGSGTVVLTTGPVGTHYEYGGAGHDVFNAGGGTSYISLGTGGSVISLAAAANAPSGATITVTGFQSGRDQISLAAIGATSANADSLISITQQTGGALLSASVGGHSEQIIFSGVLASTLNLHGADFILG